jgi:plastocyanin
MGEILTDASTTDATSAGSHRWTDLATFGFAMAATGPLLLLIATLGWGLDSDNIAFFVAPIVAAAIGIALVRQRRTGWRIVAVVLAVLIALMLFWTAFGLATPDSFFDFVPGLLVLPGALLALGAGIASIRAGRKDPTRGPSGRERPVMAGLAGVLGVLAALSAVLTVAGKDTVSEEDRQNADLVVTLSDFEYDRAAYDATAETTVLVRNDDPVVHTFTIDDLDIDVTLTPGSEHLVTLPAELGTYVVYCAPHTSDTDDPGDDDMAARLTIG